MVFRTSQSNGQPVDIFFASRPSLEKLISQQPGIWQAQKINSSRIDDISGPIDDGIPTAQFQLHRSVFTFLLALHRPPIESWAWYIVWFLSAAEGLATAHERVTQHAFNSAHEP